MNPCQTNLLGTDSNPQNTQVLNCPDDPNTSRDGQLNFLSSQLSLNDTINGLVKMLKYYKNQVSELESKIRKHELNNLHFDSIPNLSLAAKEFGKIILSGSTSAWPCENCMDMIKSHFKSVKEDINPIEKVNLIKIPTTKVDLEEDNKSVLKSEMPSFSEAEEHDSSCYLDDSSGDDTNNESSTLKQTDEIIDAEKQTDELVDVDFQTTILRKYECEKCDVQTDTYKQSIRHLMHHPDVNLYECERCGKEFHMGYRYREHMLIYKSERPFVCEDCGKAFKSERYLSRHKLVHLTEKVLSCPECNKMFCHRKGYREHILMYHYERICPVCNAVFHKRAPYNKHMDEAHQWETSRPKKPGENQDTDVIARQIKPNWRRAKPKTKLHKYPCEICGKLMSSEIGLKFHIANVHDLQRPYACSYCPKSFATKHFLIDHMQFHINENDSAVDPETREKYLRYSCDECDRSFTAARKLKEHKILHSGMREHKCQYCDKSFALKPYLHRHVRLLHQTSHPLNVICNICNKVSVSVQAHKSHMLSHTGETPYHCSVCDAKFKYVKSLRAHIKNKH